MKKKDGLTSFRLEKALKEKLKVIAETETRSMSAQMERFLKISVGKWEQENGAIISSELQRGYNFE